MKFFHCGRFEFSFKIFLFNFLSWVNNSHHFVSSAGEFSPEARGARVQLPDDKIFGDTLIVFLNLFASFLFHMEKSICNGNWAPRRYAYLLDMTQN